MQPTPNKIVQEPKTPELIQEWLVEQLAEQLQIAPHEIDINESFDSYSLSSSQILSIATKAEKAFGFKLSPVLLWHYPNVKSLSHRLVDEFEVAEQVLEI